MAVPRCKKKKGKNLSPQLKKLEIKWQNDLNRMELKATMNASQYAQLLIYYALERRFEFDTNMIGEIQAEINQITNEMKADQYDLEWVENHFKEKGIEIEV